LPADRSLDLTIALSFNHEAELNQLLSDLYDPTSPLFHQFLTPAEFSERFHATPAQADDVTAFLTQHQIRVLGRHGNFLKAAGKVSDIEAALHTELHTTLGRTTWRFLPRLTRCNFPLAWPSAPSQGCTTVRRCAAM